jgi:hypothetical protein
MKEHVNRSRARSNGHPVRNPLSDLAIEVSTRMSQMNGIPSVSTLVICLVEVRDRLPKEFDEQIGFLKSVTRYLEIYLMKPGAETLASALEQIVMHLELCGEIPCYPFEYVVAQLQEMSDFESRRYLSGLNGLARKDRWGGAERRLLALLNYSSDEMLPFAWTEEEWSDFDRLVERNQARIRELTGESATPEGTEEGGSREPGGAVNTPPSKTRGRARRRMKWKGELADLIFIIQALKDAGLLDPGTTDAAVVDCFDFESDAVDRVGLIVNARFRMANELVFPSPDLIERLREHLSKHAKPRIARKKRRSSSDRSTA